MLVYHGTSKKSWEKSLYGERTLYVTDKLWIAESYAMESAWEHEHKGLTDEPMVLAIDLSRVHGVRLEPDWGAFKVNRKDGVLYGRAHLKTGSLENVRSIAGYLLDAKGRYWSVVFIANGVKSEATKPAQEALLNWIYLQE